MYKLQNMNALKWRKTEITYAVWKFEILTQTHSVYHTMFYSTFPLVKLPDYK